MKSTQPWAMHLSPIEKLCLVIALVVVTMFLPSCAAKPGVAVETRIQVEKVPVRARCPDKGTYDGLVADQPVPLRSQAMPATAQERVAKTTAQLGRYEAQGGWADRARAALDRCAVGEDLTPSP